VEESPVPRPDRPTTFFARVEGFGGSIEVPHVGIHVGTITNWRVARRGDDGADAALFDLYASLSYVNRTLWEDAEYEKIVIVKRRMGALKYRVEQEPDHKVTLTPRMLIMEAVWLRQI
jgi:hypothetical protein